MNFKAQCEKVHYETANFVNFLNSTLAARPPGFEPGNFGVVWAAALSDTAAPVVKNIPPPVPVGHTVLVQREDGFRVTQGKIPEKEKFDPAAKRNLEELEALHPTSLRSIGNHYGVFVKGQPKEDLIKRIWEKQANVGA